jgi:predicted HicB family RNase H-like nuclease
MKRFEVRLDDSLHEKLREESYLTGKSMHQILMELIENHYKTKDEKKG